MFNNNIFVSRGDPSIYDVVLKFCVDYYSNRIKIDVNRPNHILKSLKFEPRTSWIPGMLNDPKIHDPDYSILGFLQDPDTILLDLGANWGYSAGAFFKLGIKSRIFSFEVIELFEPMLQAIRDSFSDRYDFSIRGLSDRVDNLHFVIPVINGYPNTGLCSAHEKPYLPGLAHNIVSNIRSRPEYGDALTIEFVEFSAGVDTLDSCLYEVLPHDWKNFRVAAIKIDVEGLETKVLSGGRELIIKHQPLILAEGANRTQGMRDFLKEVDYVYAERDQAVLRRHDGLGRHTNGFFLPESRLDIYRECGIYVD